MLNNSFNRDKRRSVDRQRKASTPAYCYISPIHVGKSKVSSPLSTRVEPAQQLKISHRGKRRQTDRWTGGPKLLFLKNWVTHAGGMVTTGLRDARTESGLEARVALRLFQEQALAQIVIIFLREAPKLR